MRPTLFLITLSFLAAALQHDAHAQANEKPDYSLEAFGGHLLGTDHGEWVGRLVFQGPRGNHVVLLNKNVHGIVENSAGIFVFTGLAHMSLDDGEIFTVLRNRNGEITVSSLGYLPGAPSRVRQRQSGGATSFLVYTGFSGDRRVFDCYQLIGNVVSRGQDCLPPEQAGP
jgi:hypothetical protein